MRDEKNNIFENIILIAIVLVIIQTFLDDFSTIANWNIRVQTAISLSGFFFDLLFTIEFITRLILAAAKRKTTAYLGQERGWVDFISSVPLLFLSSGPMVIMALAHRQGNTALLALIGSLNTIKIVKVIRVTRILRLMRVLKIFGKIQNAESIMAQRHIGNIAAIVITSVVAVVIINGMLSVPPAWPNSTAREAAYVDAYKNNLITTVQFIERAHMSPYEAFKQYYRNDINVLSVKWTNATAGGWSWYTKDSAALPAPNNGYKSIDEYIKNNFNPLLYNDITDVRIESFYEGYRFDFVLKLSLKPMLQETARTNLLFFLTVLLCTLALIIIYTAQFAKQITDPLFVMVKGMKDPEYYLEVKILPNKEDDEIFQLAKQYNEDYLPMKTKRNKAMAKTQTKLSMDSIFGSFAPPPEDNKK